MDWKKEFHRLRFDPAVHLGLGDIRITMAQQEGICKDIEMLLAERNSLLLDAADFFGWFNRAYPQPSENNDHPWCVMGERLLAYADDLAALRGEGES